MNPQLLRSSLALAAMAGAFLFPATAHAAGGASLTPAALFDAQAVGSVLETLVAKAQEPFIAAGIVFLVAGVVARLKQARGDSASIAESYGIPCLLAVCIAIYPLLMDNGRDLSNAMADATGSSPEEFMKEISRLNAAVSAAEPKTPVDQNKVNGSGKVSWWNFSEKAANSAAAVIKGWMVAGILGVAWGIMWLLNLIGQGLLLLIGWALTLSKILAPLALASFALPACAGIGRGFFTQIGGLIMAKCFMAIALVPVKAIFNKLVQALGNTMGLNGLYDYVISGSGRISDGDMGLALLYGPASTLLLFSIIIIVLFVLGLVAVLVGPWYGYHFLSSGLSLFAQAPQAATAEALNAGGNAMQEGARRMAEGGGSSSASSADTEDAGRTTAAAVAGVEAAAGSSSGSGGDGASAGAGGGGIAGAAGGARGGAVAQRLGSALSAIRAARARGASQTEISAAGAAALTASGVPAEQAVEMADSLAAGDAAATPGESGGQSAVGAGGSPAGAAMRAASGAAGGGGEGGNVAAGSNGAGGGGGSAGGRRGGGGRARGAALLGAVGESLGNLSGAVKGGDVGALVGSTGAAFEAGKEIVRTMKARADQSAAAQGAQDGVAVSRQMLAAMLRMEERQGATPPPQPPDPSGLPA